MYNRDFTPERITTLKANEIFVFGSNLGGFHGGGAARLAHRLFGAVWGQGVGLQCQSYAIPTMQGGVETIRPYVDDFIEFAKNHQAYKFLVTRIGCGIAGFRDEEIAPLFAEAIDVENIILPREFVEVIQDQGSTPGSYKITWNAEKDFLEEFRRLTVPVKQGGKDPNFQKKKEMRAKLFENTVALVNQGGYVTENGTEYKFPDDSDMMRNTTFYIHEFRLPDTAPSNAHTIVEVQNIDCLYAGVQLKKEGYNPAVLNMASRSHPGGGVITGARAQEETLFRRTNLFRSLFQFASFASRYGIRKSRCQYPLDRNFGGIYTPDAIYFRENEKNGYALLDNPVALSFITVAGMNRPALTPDGMIAANLVEPVKNKIRTIFRLGLDHGHDSLVLGALGCGAYHNPPRHVARLFHEVMDEPEFAGKYRKIVFAILDDHNAHRSHNREGNYKPFAEEFEGMGQPQPSEDELKALKMWTMGAGNSAKRFCGENPIPEKKTTATKDSWKNLPMPEQCAVIPMHVEIPAEAMRIVKQGHIPEAMEDHWFMYCDESTIRYYRSWTGLCIFIAQYEESGNKCVITELKVNRNSSQYGSTDNEKDTALFMALLTEEYGGDSSMWWEKALK